MFLVQICCISRPHPALLCIFENVCAVVDCELGVVLSNFHLKVLNICFFDVNALTVISMLFEFLDSS
jgi:hypothetical protein